MAVRIGRRVLLGSIMSVIIACGSSGVSMASADSGDACAVLVRKDQQTAARTVLLTGGNAWDLFRRYIEETDKQQVGISLWKSRVVMNDGKERRELSLGWIEMLTGQGAKERWAGLLKPVKAEPDDAALKDAERQQWDIVCYPVAGGAQAQGAPRAMSPAGLTRKADPPLAAKQSLQQGIQYAARRDFDNAIQEFTLAIQRHPTYATAYANRGVAYMQQKKFNLALDDLKRAVELDPTDASAHYNLTCWYSVQRQLDRALGSLDAALANGFRDYDTLRTDPELKNVRGHPEWRKTLEKHKVFLR